MLSFVSVPITDIVHASKKFQLVNFSFVSRSCNKVAHSLFCWAKILHLESRLVGTVPYCTAYLVLEDIQQIQLCKL